jgi:hypothetical protein
VLLANYLNKMRYSPDYEGMDVEQVRKSKGLGTLAH